MTDQHDSLLPVCFKDLLVTDYGSLHVNIFEPILRTESSIEDYLTPVLKKEDLINEWNDAFKDNIWQA